MIVPNKFPLIASDRKLAIIGEAPGAEEERLGMPFVGQSGRLLGSLLARAGISKEACFVGNICQHRPPDNEIALFSWNGLEIQHGLQKLREDLEKFKPNCVVLLGNFPLKAAFNSLNPKGVKASVTNWRGSVFPSEDPNSPFFQLKCLPSYHPAFCLRDYDCTPFLQLDLKKAFTQASFPEVRRIPRRSIIPTQVSDALEHLHRFRKEKKKLSYDIEGYWNLLRCIGFSTSINEAVIIPFLRMNGQRYWQPHEEILLWKEVSLLLEDPSIPKVAQNGLYDRFCLHHGMGIRVHGTTDDTMAKHWELYSELGKDPEKKKGRKGMGLAVQTSLYTDMPYYKGESDTEDDQQFYDYCGKDCMVTLEIDQVIGRIFQYDGKGTFTPAELESMKTQYKFNIELQNALLYMELLGMRYDSKKAEERRAALQKQLYAEQAKLNALTGFGFRWQNHAEIRHAISSNILVKKGDRPYKNKELDYLRLKQLLALPNPDLSTMGEIEDLCGVSLSIDSPKHFIPFLYETLGLPTQFSEKKGETPKPTSDYEALLKLSRICQRENYPPQVLAIVQSAIVIRALSTRQQMLSIHADEDGRIRCGYNNVGPNTGRIACYESPTGSGYNLQTIPNYTEIAEAPGGILGDRDLFLADEDHFYFQCDLAGADGWTVAAYSASLGDDTMLLDYKAGLRPFEILVLRVMGKTVPKERRDIREECKLHVKKDSFERFMMKRVQHGGCYMEGEITISRNILKDSEGKMYLPPSECGLLKKEFFGRYPGVSRWHDWVASRLKARPVLQAASGQVRLFFGRPDEVLTKAVAFEPQANTTYATNKAMHRLWFDPDNRVILPNGKVALRIQPLHQVHDALCGQFLRTDTTWAAPKIKSYFDNTMLIAGIQINIPYDGGYGPSWGRLDVGKL